MGLGSDFDGVEDLDEFLTFLSGDESEIVAYMQAIARRYSTPRFGLFYDANYGLDLRMFLADTFPRETVQGLIEAEARKDPRTKDASAAITDAPDGGWLVEIKLTTQTAGAGTLTLAVSSVSVDILSAE